MKRLKGSYGSYAGTYFFYFFSLAVFSSSVLSVYLGSIGKDEVEISFIASASSLVSLGVVPLSGWLFDRVAHTKRLFSAFFAAAGLLGLVFALCRAVWILFLLNGLIAASINSLDPLNQKIASSSKYRYGTIRVWGTLGYATATQLGALVIDLRQARLVFLLLLCGAALSVFFFCFTDPVSVPAASAQKREALPGARRDRHFIKNPYFLLYLALSLFFFSMSGANMTYAPLLLQRLGIPTNIVGTVLSLGVVIELPILLFSNKFMDRFNGKTLLLVAFLMSGLQYLCYGLSRSAGFTVAVLLVFMATSSTLFMMISLKIVRNLVPPTRIATALGMVGFGNSVGLSIMLNISGQIVRHSGMESLYLLYAGLCAMGVLLTLPLKIGNSEMVFSGRQDVEAAGEAEIFIK